MRSKRVTRYYCDHCSKGMLQRTAMERHERGCTLNKDRRCGMCEAAGIEQKPMSEIIEAARYDHLNGEETQGRDTIPKRLRETTGHCPACMLAGIRLLRASLPKPSGCWTETDGPIEHVSFDFDWKRELASFWEASPREELHPSGNAYGSHFDGN